MIHNYFLSPNLSEIKARALASNNKASLFIKSATEHDEAFTTFTRSIFLDDNSKFLPT